LFGVASKAKLAGKLWAIRASTASTFEVQVNAGTKFWECPAFWIGYSTSPYLAYREFLQALTADRLVSQTTKLAFPVQIIGRVSQAFRLVPDIATIDTPDTSLFRYLLHPRRLCGDMEKTVEELAADLRDVAQHYLDENRMITDYTAETTEAIMSELDFQSYVDERMRAFKDIYTAASELDQNIALLIIDTLEEDESQASQDLMSRNYKDGEELLELFRAYRSLAVVIGNLETVR
jgi:hypothetical protein